MLLILFYFLLTVQKSLVDFTNVNTGSPTLSLGVPCYLVVHLFQLLISLRARDIRPS